jgi:MEMO1 family protein
MNEFNLTETEKNILLDLAYNTINEYITNRKIISINDDKLTDALKTNCGAFVSLHKNGSLRGCIGNFSSDTPLYKIIIEMAISASTQDPRFSPVSKSELNDLEIEISVLTPLKKINDISEIELGKHGIYIIKDYCSGTFLPQVAEQTGWSLEEFLGHCAEDKAGIGWNGWKEADIYTYEAIIFSR